MITCLVSNPLLVDNHIGHDDCLGIVSFKCHKHRTDPATYTIQKLILLKEKVYNFLHENISKTSPWRRGEATGEKPQGGSSSFGMWGWV